MRWLFLTSVLRTVVMPKPTPQRLWRGLLNVLFWPFRTLRRMTADGFKFVLLAVCCAVVAARADQFANIPLLITLVLFSVLWSALILGTNALRTLKITRHCVERTFAGEPVTVTLAVQNTARVPVAGLMLSEVVRSLPTRVGGPAGVDASSAQESQRLLPVALGRPNAPSVGGGQAFAAMVSGRGVERVRYRLLVRRRGIYHFGRTQLDTVFPLGFWRSHAARRVPGRLVVYPRLGEIDTALFQEMEAAVQRLRRSRPSREEQDFRSLREYRPGDNPKWIHWRSSARQGKMLVKEYEEPQTRRVFLLLDTNLQRLGPQRLPAFELALSFAATCTRELARHGCEVTCAAMAPDTQPNFLTVSRERRNLDTLLEMLAGLQPDSTRTLTDLRGHIRREDLRQVFILVLGLGSLRVRADLTWLRSPDCVVKMLDVRGEEFRRLFRRTSSATPGREDTDEDLLLALGDEELDALAQEELALVG